MAVKRRPRKEVYTISYSEGVLAKLKDLAHELDVPEGNLNEVLAKGIRLLDFAKDGKVIVEKHGVKYEMDLKKV